MTIQKVSLSQERKIIINLIMSTAFCKAVLPLVKKQYWKVNYSSEVASWVTEYFSEYGRAPGKDIKSIYQGKRTFIANEETQDAIADFLTSLNDQFTQAPEINDKYEIDEATKYLQLRAIEILRDELSDKLLDGDLEAGTKTISKFEMPASVAGIEAMSLLGELEIKPPSWMVEGLMEQNTTTVLFGDSENYKTFFALALGASVASGFDFGSFACRASGPVVYLCGEGRDTIRRRLKAWEIEHEVSLKEYPFYMFNLGLQLIDPATMAPLANELRKLAETVGKPTLVILDTWGRLSGSEENSASDTNKAIIALDALCQPYGASRVIVHHSGLADKTRPRGSIALHNAVDNEYRFECASGAGGSKTIAVKNSKCKDGRPPEEFFFGLKDVGLGIPDEHGQEIGSAVMLIRGDYVTQAKPRAEKLRGNVQKTLDALREVIKETDDHAIISLWRMKCTEAGIKEATFFGNRKNLIDRSIVVLDHGHYKIKTDPLALTMTLGSIEPQSKVIVKVRSLGTMSLPNSEQSQSHSAKLIVDQDDREIRRFIQNRLNKRRNIP